MPKTLAEINAALGSLDAQALTQIIADIKASVRVSDAGVIADLQQQLTDAQTTHVAAQQASADALATAQAEVNALRKMVTDSASAIRQAVLDPDTPTEDAVLAIIDEVTKPARDKAVAAATEKRNAAQAELDALLSGAVPVADEQALNAK